MSEEMNVDQIESSNDDKTEDPIVRYSTRLMQRTIERALDVIYEQTNVLDPKIYEWRHSADTITISSN